MVYGPKYGLCWSVFSCWMRYSIVVKYIQLIDDIVQFNYILACFLPAGSVHYDRGILKSPTMIVDLFISSWVLLLFASWILRLLGTYTLKIIVVLDNWPLYHYVMLFFIPNIFFSLKSLLFEANITSPAFFWLVSMVYLSLSFYF